MSMLVAVFCARPVSWPVEYPNPISESDPILAVTLTFLSGAILVLLGVLNLGFIVNFISHAVIVGFVSAAAILISFSQVKKLFGIKLHHREIVFALPELCKEIIHGKTNWYDFAMGMTCMIILKSFDLLKRKYQNDETLHPVLRKTIWLVGTARNAFVVIVAAIIAFGVDNQNIDYWKEGCTAGGPNCTTFTLTKIKDASMPGFQLPQFSYSYNVTNGTGTDGSELMLHYISFLDILKALSSGLFIIPLMAYLESISIAKGFAIKNEYKIDATQELVRKLWF